MIPSPYHLAQLNIAGLKCPIDSPQLEESVSNIERINQMAETHPGFVWRMTDDSSELFDPLTYVVNLYVWESIEALKEFTYKTGHANIIRKRKKWFENLKSNYIVMWWIPEKHIPTVGEAKERLELLDQKGPTKEAFTFRELFERPA